ncbi:hypothetical protein [Staphylococcus epidermidis]|uniref:hypothetical protein n=1 Tax=Staphylococcus epidermidis TaxID=1282 RepID=UPI0038713BE3
MAWQIMVQLSQKDDEGYVVIKPLADRYNNQLKYAKAKKMVQDNKLNKKTIRL